MSRTVVYMLQSVEYQPVPYLKWFWRTEDFRSVMKRRTLDYTRVANLLRRIVALGMALQIICGCLLVLLGAQGLMTGGILFGLATLVSYPVVWAHLVIAPLLLGRLLVVVVRERRAASLGAASFAKHTGVRIAVVGSYGKTTMKELLQTVLSEGMKVKASKGNMNVLSSHARFARTIEGDEDALIIEFGEGKPGDIARLSELTRPTHAVITGLAPAHLDRYKNLDAAARDIFSISEYVPSKYLYVNSESAAITPYLRSTYRKFDSHKVLGWVVSSAKTDITGTSFRLTKGDRRLKLSSTLLGAHQVAPLAFVAAFALQLGLNEAQVVAGIAKTEPFAHRMQAYMLGGAWVIDDTYNGNLEGIKAGTELLAGLQAQRKIYVTPGLVDQGSETAGIHRTVGRLIAAAHPDVVVLMQNSVTAHIQAGLEDTDFSGEVIVQDDPLEFYTNLGSFVAAGDVVLMQNDWTDNYA